MSHTYEIETGINKSYTYNSQGLLVNVVTTKGPSILSQVPRTYDGVKMISYDRKPITYDDLGNPLTYYNGTQFTWQMGRQLESAQLSDGTQISYKYNADGLRTEKKVGNKTTSYTLVGSKITGQTDGTNKFYFRYDENDNLVGFELGSDQYFYITNLVGDIIAIVDNDGNCVVEYEYDPWGVCTIVSDTSNCNLGELNPFRYRGYYYDEDTNLYYLQSRYYDPVTCKFINADDPMIIYQTAYNPLAVHLWDYCDGNPIVFIDESGYRYNPNAALQYAKKWWNGRHSGYYNYGKSDCANFVSQCLFAGRLSSKYGTGRNSGWHSYLVPKRKGPFLYKTWDVSYSWSMVDGLKRWLINCQGFKVRYITTLSQMKSFIKKNYIKKGMIAFMSTEYDGNVTHAVLIGRVTSKNVYYYAHSSNRDANKNQYGFAEYFNENGGRGLIAILYISGI